jgi:hypothetical protein
VRSLLGRAAAHHLEIVEGGRLPDREGVGGGLLDDGGLELGYPLHPVLQGGQLASAGGLIERKEAEG